MPTISDRLVHSFPECNKTFIPDLGQIHICFGFKYSSTPYRYCLVYRNQLK
uniref:Uncharacterized protein n=1 Tax=Anguilla anguilla TaxID=7936 RepID=A0A0E9V6K3_ANGAN